MAYDERHGYRGPLGRVELPNGAANAAAIRSEPAEIDADALRALLDDYRPLLDYESAIVLARRRRRRASVFRGARRAVDRFRRRRVGGAVHYRRHDRARADHGRRGIEAGRRRALPPHGRRRLAARAASRGARRVRLVDPFDGAIVALNGGFDFFLNNFNRATQARRQPARRSSRSCTRRRSRTALRRRPSSSTRRPTSATRPRSSASGGRRISAANISARRGCARRCTNR